MEERPTARTDPPTSPELENIELESLPAPEKEPPAPHLSLTNRLIGRVGRSRYSGLALGPVYGGLIYVYVTYLILWGPPFTHTTQDTDYTALMSAGTSHVVGGGIGLVSGAGLTVSSLYSKRVRCTMALIGPSLLTKRGRSFMITFTIGLLMQGPVKTLRFNLYEVAQSYQCMYEEMKALGYHVMDQFVTVLDQFLDILTDVKTLMEKYLIRLEADVDAEEELASAKEALVRIKAASEAIAAAISIPTSLCSGVISSTTDIGKKISQYGSRIQDAIADLFSEWWGEDRRKRCADVFTVSVDLGSLTVDKLKEFLLYTNPDLEVDGMDADALATEIDTTSIKYLRETVNDIFDNSLETLQFYGTWLSKLLYLSILVLIFDANSYLTDYYEDIRFDNRTVNDNLKTVRGKKKLTPLRQWELSEGYNSATDVRLTGEELVNLLTASLSSIFATFFILTVVITDLLFALALEAFREHSSFGVSYPGMEQGVELSSLLDGSQSATIEIDAYDLDLDPCLPNPRRTRAGVLWPLFLTLLFCLVSCAADAYFCRLRAVICNAFYEKWAGHRALYLYDKISSGRKTRHLELSSILRRNKRCRERSKKFSYSRKVRKTTCSFCNCNKKLIKTCLACDKLLLTKGSALDKTFEYNDNLITEPICDECNIME